MNTNRFILFSLAILMLAATESYADKAKGYGGVDLPDDNLTIDTNSMKVTNTGGDCDEVVKYAHNGDYKTIGWCEHTGNPNNDIRGDFSYNFEMKVLYRNDSSKGFSLKGFGKCHYQTQMVPIGGGSAVPEWMLDCKSTSSPSIIPFGGACPNTHTVTAKGNNAGVSLHPTCN